MSYFALQPDEIHFLGVVIALKGVTKLVKCFRLFKDIILKILKC